MYKCFSWVEDSPCYKRNSAEISVEFQVLAHYLRLGYMISWVGFPFFLNGLGYQMPCGPLVGFRETKIHSRAHGGCHLSTFSGRGVTESDYGLTLRENFEVLIL